MSALLPAIPPSEGGEGPSSSTATAERRGQGLYFRIWPMFDSLRPIIAVLVLELRRQRLGFYTLAGPRHRTGGAIWRTLVPGNGWFWHLWTRRMRAIFFTRVDDNHRPPSRIFHHRIGRPNSGQRPPGL